MSPASRLTRPILKTDIRRDRVRLELLTRVGTTHALISGTFGTVPRLPPSPLNFGHGEERRLALRRTATGSFSGFGVTGPSRNSKPSLSRPASSLLTTTRT